MSKPQALKCPGCGSPLRLEDWDTAAGIIKCSFCRALSTLPGSQPGGGPPDKKTFPPRADIPLPPRIQVDFDGTTTVITRRWFTPLVYLMIFFCVAWDSFLIFWYGLSLRIHPPWIFFVFPLAHVAVGIGITYTTLATLVNRTVIEAGRGRLRITHAPLPWRGNAEFETHEITQLFCKETITRNKQGPSWNYEVWVNFQTGQPRKLASLGASMEAALFIEQSLEKALGIQDRPVPGEVSRG